VTDFAEVPSTLKNIPNWVSWKLIKKDGEDSKVPFIPGTVRHASSTDSLTWTTFDAALANTSVGRTEGVGFVIQGRAVDEQIVGFDLDGCRDPKTGDITSWAEAIVNQLDSYTEFTPSGFGLRVWVKGKLPGKDRVFNLATNAGFGKKVKIEVFDKARYFAVTSQSFFEESCEVETRDLTEVYKLCSEFKKQFPVNQSTEIETDGNTTEMTSAQIKQAGTVITNKLHLLMTGKIVSEKPVIIEDGLGNSIEYPSRSEADMALCTQLALEHGSNPDLIAAEFAKSCLYREKWERDTYQTPTINRAITTAEKIKAKQITPNSTTTPTVSAGKPVPFVTVDGDQFLKEKIRPRKVLLRTISNCEPVFFDQSINQIFAWRGLGKTCLGLGLTGAFAKGGKLLNWEVPEPIRVLYIEGELPESQIQERWRQIIGETNGYARLATIDKQPDHMFPSLATPKGMERVESTLAQLESEGFKTEVLVLDSISTLFNVSANDEENWITIQSWLIGLRSRGICIFFFHHAGKSGMSRSHSKSEDMLDVSIKLDFPKEKEEGGLHAVMSYDKARAGLSEPPAEIKMRRVHTENCFCRKAKSTVIGCPGDKVEWIYQLAIDTRKTEALQMFSEGTSVTAVSRTLKIPVGTVKTWRTAWGTSQRPDTTINLDAG
jgi:putative DNA primase/helicase